MYQSYYTCLTSDVAKSGDGTLDMLALQWWKDQVSCQQSIVGQPAGLRLPSEVSSRSEGACNKIMRFIKHMHDLLTKSCVLLSKFMMC